LGFCSFHVVLVLSVLQQFPDLLLPGVHAVIFNIPAQELCTNGIVTFLLANKQYPLNNYQRNKATLPFKQSDVSRIGYPNSVSIKVSSELDDSYSASWV
jgi:hypothetical protein